MLHALIVRLLTSRPHWGRGGDGAFLPSDLIADWPASCSLCCCQKLAQICFPFFRNFRQVKAPMFPDGTSYQLSPLPHSPIILKTLPTVIYMLQCFYSSVVNTPLSLFPLPLFQHTAHASKDTPTRQCDIKTTIHTTPQEWLIVVIKNKNRERTENIYTVQSALYEATRYIIISGGVHATHHFAAMEHNRNLSL